VTKSLRLISIVLLLCIGLLQAQWQGFTHAIEHAQHVEHVISLESSSDSNSDNQAVAQHKDFHHCAAYDSLTLAHALTSTPEPHLLSHAKHVAEKFYKSQQASIEAHSAFDARGPPNYHASV
jgi:hypothetical protein